MSIYCRLFHVLLFYENSCDLTSEEIEYHRINNIKYKEREHWFGEIK